MTGRRKLGVYLLGVLIGCLLLMMIPRERGADRREHPWHAQTAPEGSYPLRFEDDFGRELELTRQPRYFISLAPSLTEIVFAMEMGDHLMAVTRYDDFPEGAKILRDAGGNVGDMDQPNLEQIAAYRPDLVLASTHTPRSVVERIHRPPETVSAAFDHASFGKVKEDIATLGKILGVPGKALDLLRELEAEMAAVDASVAGWRAGAAPDVLMLYGLEENLQPGWSPGAGTWVSNLIERAGARNILEGIGASWGEPNLESVLSADPDVLLIRDGLGSSERAVLRERLARLGEHPVWGHVAAVKKGRVHLIEPGPLTIPGPRMPEAYRLLAEAIWR